MSEEERLRMAIHAALDSLSRPTPDFLPVVRRRIAASQRRRPLFAFARAATVVAAALLIGGAVLSMHRSRVAPPTVATSPSPPIAAGPGANIAWVISYSPGGGAVATGIDDEGHIVGRIDAAPDLRSPDAAHLYAVANSEIEVYSALDGRREQSIPMRVATDAAIEMLSPDGRYMVLGASSRNSVEVIDLVAAKSVFSLNLGSSPYAIPIVDAGAQHIYLIGSAITKISVHGDSTQLLRKNPMSCDGLALGGPNSAGGLPFRILADGHTLVAFCPSNGHVSWFDLDRMTLTGDVAVGQNNPFWLSPVFSKDASTLYLHEGGTGTIHVVDLVHRKIVRSTTVARADRNPLAWLGSMLVTPAYAGGIPRTAAISPDANWLYAVGAFGAPGGVSLIHIPDLKISGRWLAANEYDALWVSADGRTLFLMDQNASRVTVVRTDGSPVAMVAVPSNLNTFLIPTIP